MKRTSMVLPAALAALSLAAVAWAGGSMCTGKPQGSAAQAAGSHCPMGEGAQAAGDHCSLGANQAVLSYAVPGAECDACVKTIQRAAMALKGVSCAHVNLENRTAYIVAEKSVKQAAIAKTIRDAGFRCTFKADGPKVRTELMKAMASGGSAAFCAKKEKEKV